MNLANGLDQANIFSSANAANKAKANKAKVDKAKANKAKPTKLAKGWLSGYRVALTKERSLIAIS